MPTLACSNCPKTFKTQNGLRWHLAHAHLDLVEKGSTGARGIPAVPCEGEAEELPDMAGLTEDKLEVLLHETLKRVEELQSTHGLDSESCESVQEDLGRIGGRVKELEAITGGLRNLRSDPCVIFSSPES